MWKTNQFATAAELVAWMNTAGLTATHVKHVYFDAASGRHVVVYFQ
jgi:hypothetical protein